MTIYAGNRGTSAPLPKPARSPAPAPRPTARTAQASPNYRARTAYGTRAAAPSGATQRIAAKLASKSSRTAAPARLAGAIANQTRLATRAPFAPIAGSDLLQSRPLRQMMFQGQFNQDFQALKDQGLIPQNAKEPPLTFPLRAMGSEGQRSFETGTADAGNALIHVSPSVLFQATQASGFTPGRAWALETPLHELAHALQKPQVLKSVPLREGGAQAFADAAAVRAIGPISENDTNYTNYVRNVRAKKGPAFFMRRQFG